jgi:RimJ/RimL family protein N-acetyltransferase
MRLRRATMDDALDVLAWRNDPLAVAMSKTPGAIGQETHLAWFARAIRNEDRVLLVAMGADQKLGMVRFDRTGEAWLVSITIAPEQRGKGFSVGILQQAITWFRADHGHQTLLAEIKEDNAPSLKLFERCGFKKQGQTEGLCSYSLS